MANKANRIQEQQKTNIYQNNKIGYSPYKTLTGDCSISAKGRKKGFPKNMAYFWGLFL